MRCANLHNFNCFWLSIYIYNFLYTKREIQIVPYHVRVNRQFQRNSFYLAECQRVFLLVKGNVPLLHLNTYSSSISFFSCRLIYVFSIQISFCNSLMKTLIKSLHVSTNRCFCNIEIKRNIRVRKGPEMLVHLVDLVDLKIPRNRVSNFFRP